MTGIFHDWISFGYPIVSSLLLSGHTGAPARMAWLWMAGPGILAVGVAGAFRWRQRSRRRREEARERVRTGIHLREYARGIVESSPTGYVLVDAQWRVLASNTPFRKLTQATEADLTRQPIEQWIETTSPAGLSQWTQQRISHGEGKLKVPGDGWKPVGLVLTTLLAPATDQCCYLLRVEDMTEHRQMEERYRLLFERNMAAIVLADYEGTISDCNEAYAQMLGFQSPAEVRGRSILEFYWHREDRLRMLAKMREKGYLDRYELELRHQSGESVWVLVSTAPLGDEAGAADIVQTTLIDITDRKRAQQRIAESNKKIVEIFESITEGFVALDREWRFTYVNHEAERMLRIESSELMGRDAREATPGLASGPFREHFEKAAREAEKVEFEAFSAAVGGWLEVRVYPSAAGLSIYFRDVSERRKLEARVRQSEKMESLGRLAGGIAHDFNNLLNVIGGYGELLALTVQEGSPQARYAREIHSACQRASAMTRQLLAFGRRDRTTPRPLNINAVLLEMEAIVQRLVGEDIDVILEPGESLGLINADPTQIEQVVMNLAANARDAMPRGGRLLLETANLHLEEPLQDEQMSLQPGDYVLLTASDNGAGIDPSVKGRIFEPFFTTKDVGKGTGLGLATVNGIVQQSGGAVWVYSTPRQGTTFKLYFPRTAAAGTQESAEAPQETAAPGGKESILLVEDEEALRALVREMLESFGYHVTTAVNGEEALRRMEDSGPFQLLITDVLMPGMGGAELADRVAAKAAGLAVMFISGYTGRAMLRQGNLRAGAHFLSKPFTRQRLARAVRDCLDGNTAPPHGVRELAA